MPIRIERRVRNFAQDDERGVEDAHPPVVMSVGNPAHEHFQKNLCQWSEDACDVDAVELANNHLGRPERCQSPPAAARTDVAIGRFELFVAEVNVRRAGGLSWRWMC